MILNKTGKYKTNREYKGRTSYSIWTIPKDTEFEVCQIDEEYHKFYSDMFGDWTYWDKDVVSSD